ARRMAGQGAPEGRLALLERDDQRRALAGLDQRRPLGGGADPDGQRMCVQPFVVDHEPHHADRHAPRGEGDRELLLRDVDGRLGGARVGDVAGGRDAEEADGDGGCEQEEPCELHASPYGGWHRSGLLYDPRAVALLGRTTLDRTIVRLLPAVPKAVVRRLSEPYIAGST